MAKVTIIIPVYNVELYLKRCLDSVIAQSFKDYDVILIDDGSTDNSLCICEEYASWDSRFHVLHQRYEGVSGARNVGLDWALNNSDSSWITFVDSDDWINPICLEAMMDAVVQNNASVAVVDFERTNGDNPIVNPDNLSAVTEEVENYYCRDYIHFITLWGKLYQKNDLKNIRFPDGKIHEDEYVTWKILFKYPCTAIIHEPLYAYFRNPKGIMGSPWSLGRLDALAAFEERLIYFNNTKKYPKAREALINHYQWHLLDSIKQVKERWPNNKQLNRSLKNRLQRFLKEADYTIIEHEGLYEIAYPCTFKYRWAIAVRLKRKEK